MEEFPDSIDDRFGLAKSYSDARNTLLPWWGGNNEQAEAALTEADKRLSALLEERPGDRNIREALGNALTNLGVVLTWMDRHAEAEE